MADKQWDEALAKYRLEPIGERVYHLLSKPYLINLALAWEVVKKDLAPPQGDTLEDLWTRVNFSFSELSDLTDLSVIKTMKDFNLLKESQIILPDGTLNQYARALISGKVKESLDALFPKASKLQKEA